MQRKFLSNVLMLGTALMALPTGVAAQDTWTSKTIKIVAPVQPGGIVGSAAADGYTLLLGYVGTHDTNPALRKLRYDAVEDFSPIAMVGGTPKESPQ